eukprot:TRINITY_DN72973_c0_g1_i2.p3 TRINITY_DN72973_c0_g1~~TRINITY_DN72973_c0_g1_i2.p3  ORF type:complete len:207 (+),score=34.47 TRINITY_DN72973_c0_g1_i2:36-623(+)
MVFKFPAMLIFFAACVPTLFGNEILEVAESNVTEAAVQMSSLLEIGELAEAEAVIVSGFDNTTQGALVLEIVVEMLEIPGLIVDAFVAALTQLYTTPTNKEDLEVLMTDVFSNITVNGTVEEFVSMPVAGLVSLTFTNMGAVVQPLFTDSMTAVVTQEGCDGISPLLQAGEDVSGSLITLYNGTLAKFAELADCM